MQDALFVLAPIQKYAKHACPQCGKKLIASEPQQFEGCVNVDLRCEDHGLQFTVSTNTEAQAKAHV